MLRGVSDETREELWSEALGVMEGCDIVIAWGGALGPSQRTCCGGGDCDRRCHIRSCLGLGRSHSISSWCRTRSNTYLSLGRAVLQVQGDL